MLLSCCIASRIAGRPTPKRSIRSRSDGIASPGCNSPLVISDFQPIEHFVRQFAANDRIGDRSVMSRVPEDGDWRPFDGFART